jgi:vacuolar-type H+-ATPase subunit I/STV1
MDTSDRKRWLRAVGLLGVVYFVIGIAFGAFASWSASNSMRVTWNRLAFLASAVAFAVHIGYEHFRFGNSPRITASHASIAVALGAFALALVANIHDLWSASGYRPRMLIALVAWPLLTAVPAFIVALVLAAGLTLRRRSI